MIIICPSCNKKFEIDASLIPEEGRDLQCGSCQHLWFYKDVKEIPEPLVSKENITNQELFSDDQDELQIDKIVKKTKNKYKSPKIEIKKDDSNLIGRFFSYLIVFIISMVAVVVLIDTFKNPLIDIFPALELILFNLFETLKDIKLFIIDLS